MADDEDYEDAGGDDLMEDDPVEEADMEAEEGDEGERIDILEATDKGTASGEKVRTSF